MALRNAVDGTLLGYSAAIASAISNDDDALLDLVEDFLRGTLNRTIEVRRDCGSEEWLAALALLDLSPVLAAERVEAVDAGTAVLVATDEDTIVERSLELLGSSESYAAMARAVNPYGDGKAAYRAAAAIEHLLG
jgi:UDP-N-acetylglucosamine 2-epimerase (non-hydrolysing)